LSQCDVCHAKTPEIRTRVAVFCATSATIQSGIAVLSTKKDDGAMNVDLNLLNVDLNLLDVHLNLLNVDLNLLDVDLNLLNVHLNLLNVHLDLLNVHLNLLDVHLDLLNVHPGAINYLPEMPEHSVISNLVASFSATTAPDYPVLIMSMPTIAIRRFQRRSNLLDNYTPFQVFSTTGNCSVRVNL